jgi:hypothetical protein
MIKNNTKQQEEKRPSRLGIGTRGLAGLYLGQQTLRSGIPRALGVRLESHSTSNKNARDILKNGGWLDPNKSGTGAIRGLENSQGIGDTTDINKAKGKVYITGARADSIARDLPTGIPFQTVKVDPAREDPLTQVLNRKDQRLGYRAQSLIDWDEISKNKFPTQELRRQRIEKLGEAYLKPWKGRSLYVGGSDDYFMKNFKPDFDDPRAMYTDKKLKVYGNRLSASLAAIKKEGLGNLIKSNPKRVGAGLTILGGGGYGTYALLNRAYQDYKKRKTRSDKGKKRFI